MSSERVGSERFAPGLGSARVAALTLAVAYAAFGVQDYLSLRQKLARDLAMAAEGVALGLAPFVERNDLEGAQAVLRALAARPDVLHAGLLGREGQLRSRYVRPGVAMLPPAPEPAGPPRFGQSRLRVFEDVVDGGGRRMGMLFVETTTDALGRRALTHAALGASFALLTLFLVVWTRVSARAPTGGSEPEGGTARTPPPTLVPVAARPPTAPALPPRAEPAVQTVLVIDDDDETRELLARGLAREGFHVVTAADWEQGLRRAREVRPDLITLDALMPDTDGWSVLRALKDDAAMAHIPVVMTTLVREGRPVEARRHEYLLKPLAPERLAAVVGPQRASEPAVLVVSEDEEARRQLREALLPQGWLVLEAESSEAAQQLMAGALPDVVLIDFDGALRHGVEFLEALRGNSGWSEIPVVVVSACELRPDERAAIEAPVPRVFQKSALSSRELARQIRGLLAGGREVAARRAGAS